MSNVGYRIIKNFERPAKELVEKFRGIPAANVGDCMNRTASLGSSLQPLNETFLLGTAYTIFAPAGDNLLFYYAIDNAKPGDVIVVASGGFTGQALCGEIMSEMAKKQGIAGFVVDGAVRDKKYLSEMDFPVYAAGFNSNGPFKNGPGTINIPVSIGNQIIYPGDIVIGDDTGIVTVRPHEAEEIYQNSLKIVEKEKSMLDSIAKTGKMDLSWMYEKLQASGCEIIDN